VVLPLPKKPVIIVTGKPFLPIFMAVVGVGVAVEVIALQPKISRSKNRPNRTLNLN
jgi:hypothetical protein